jgi:hypothetical protein
MSKVIERDAPSKYLDYSLWPSMCIGISRKGGILYNDAVIPMQTQPNPFGLCNFGNCCVMVCEMNGAWFTSHVATYHCVQVPV